jgi:multidrug efflux system outer membrane protein
MSMRTATLSIALLLGGCTLAPKYERGPAPVPASWPAGDAYTPDYSGVPIASYRQLFQDDGLQKIIALALENNRDLRQAAANIERARAQVRIQRSDLFPQVNAGANATRSAASNSPAVDTSSANLSITAYEIDLFGRIRSLTDSARNSYLATQSDAQAIRLALIGDIVQAWLSYGADRSLRDISTATVETALKSVDLTQARLSGGIAPRTDLRQAQTILATAQSDLARSTTALAQDRNLLDLLVGAPVDPALLPGSIEQAGPKIGEPSADMSSQVLLRRPDIMSAEYALRAANAEIGAARAALFPRITLGALFGLVGTSVESLFGNAGTEARQGSAAITYPIFQAGAARAGVDVSKAQRDALLAAYEKSIQTGYREVADALARRGTINDQLGADRLRAQASADSYYLSDARYRGGVDSFLQSLDAQRTYYAAQRNLVASELEAANNRVALYRALGGEEAAKPAPLSN